MIDYLSLDIGERIIGVAVGEEASGLVFPRPAIDQNQIKGELAIRKLWQDNKIQAIVVGMPLNSDGSESLQCAKIRKFVTKCEIPATIKLVYWNEYASTKEAQNRFHAYGAKRISREVIDSTAAIIILESYFRSNSK